MSLTPFNGNSDKSQYLEAKASLLMSVMLSVCRLTAAGVMGHMTHSRRAVLGMIVGFSGGKVVV